MMATMRRPGTTAGKHPVSAMSVAAKGTASQAPAAPTHEEWQRMPARDDDNGFFIDEVLSRECPAIFVTDLAQAMRSVICLYSPAQAP